MITITVTVWGALGVLAYLCGGVMMLLWSRTRGTLKALRLLLAWPVDLLCVGIVAVTGWGRREW